MDRKRKTKLQLSTKSLSCYKDINGIATADANRRPKKADRLNRLLDSFRLISLISYKYYYWNKCTEHKRGPGFRKLNHLL